MNLDNIVLLPRPGSIGPGEGSYTLESPVRITVSEEAQDLLHAVLSHDAPPGLEGRLEVESETGIGSWLLVGDIPLPEAPTDPESYRLLVAEGGIALVSFTRQGFQHGCRTLAQLLAQCTESVPAMDIQDAPALAGRAIMIDMVRTKEQDHVYFNLLKQMASWKMNVLFLHFIDNQGCTIELKSHPELTSPYAMSQDTVRELIAIGNQLGVRIIPEIEPWGHAKWITDKYPHFAEPESNSLCLAAEGIYPLLEDIIEELAELFPDPYFHIGCDEADYGKHDVCSALAEKSSWEDVIAGHINRINRMARASGKTSLIWADVIIRSDEILKRLDKDIIAEEWYYFDDLEPDRIQRLTSNGFKCWAAPALMMGSWRVIPSGYNLANVERYSQIARDEGAEGCATTIWLPQRYIPGNTLMGVARAAECGWSAEPADRSQTYAGVLVSRFGLESTPERIQRLAAFEVIGQRNPRNAFWTDLETLQQHKSEEARAANAQYAKQVTGLAEDLAKDVPEVRANLPEWDSLILTARIGEHFSHRRRAAESTLDALALADQGLKSSDESEKSAGLAALSGAAALLYTLEKERQRIWAGMQSNWDRDRYPDHPMRTGEEGGTNSLYWWMGSAETHIFSLQLAEELEKLAADPNPARIAELLGETTTEGITGQDSDVHVDS